MRYEVVIKVDDPEITSMASKINQLIKVRKAIRLDGDDEVPDGWDLFIEGEWHERYRLKREADGISLIANKASQ